MHSILPKLMRQISPGLRRFMLLTLLMVFSLPSFALTFTVDGIKYETVISDEVQVAEQGSSVSGDIIIPKTVAHSGRVFKVTSIGSDAFSGCSALTTITLPNSVESIGAGAFSGCSALTSITIPNSVTSIERYTFYGCSSLKSITIPNSVTSIERDTFSGCSGLTSITIPDSVTSIGGDAFFCCSSLTSITLPNSVTSIGYGAFGGCSSLTSITLPNSVTSIGNGAFSGCSSLTSITIPNSVTSIGSSAFSCCSSLTSIIIPNSVTSIGSYAFEDCTGLTSITLPNSVTSIGSSTFSRCSSLTSITLPNSVTLIGDYAFFHCSSLTTLTLPESVKSLGSNCFNGCDLQPLKIRTKDPLSRLPYDAFNKMKTTSVIVCHDVNYKGVKALWDKVYSFDAPLIIDLESFVRYIAGVDFKTVANPYYEGDNSDVQFFVEIPKANITDMPVTVGKSNFIDGLKMNTNYSLKLYYYSGEEKVVFYEYSFNTKKPSLNVDREATQTTVTIKSISYDTDKTCTPTVYVDNKEYKGGTLKFTGLCPNSSIYVKAIYTGVNDYIYEYLRSRDISVNIPKSVVYPNAIESEGNYEIGDTKLMKVEWLQGKKVISSSKRLALTGLVPEREYTVDFKVTVGYGESGTYSKSSSITVKTKPLELEMQLPKSVGNGKTIVSAKTNLSESEANVGFEWKKTDAPSTLPYSVGYSAIYDGHLEGLIKNLQNAYYNVRAFYKDADGNHYYTDIVSFDPTDFSFFEPTVHTYPAEPEENHATLRGYVLGGTDNILGQGFQYWIVPDGAQHAQRYQAPATDAGVMTVAADGQRMAVVISDLKPGTTYAYRAYAETASGVKYGEEQTFVTPGSAGIEDIAVDEADVTVIG